MNIKNPEGVLCTINKLDALGQGIGGAVGREILENVASLRTALGIVKPSKVAAQPPVPVETSPQTPLFG